MDSSRIFVMDQGRLAESGSPEQLLQNAESLFARLVSQRTNTWYLKFYVTQILLIVKIK